jgi:hypothetical protein
VKIRFWLAVALVMGLAACGTPSTLPAPSTLQPVRVFHPPALRWAAGEMARCASEQPGLALYRLEAAAPVSLVEGDVQLWWGAPAQEAEHLFMLGEADWQVIAHPSRGEVTLSEQELINRFSGQNPLWPDGSPVQVWVYAPGDPLWQNLAVTLGFTSLATDAQIAPDPTAMRAAVAADPKALGFLPAHEVDESVLAAHLNEKLAEKLRQPITATLPVEPEGVVRAWLQCLQSSWQP